MLLELLDVNRACVRIAPFERPVPHETRERFFLRERPVAARDGDLLVQMLKGIAPYVLPQNA